MSVGTIDISGTPLSALAPSTAWIAVTVPASVAAGEQPIQAIVSGNSSSLLTVTIQRNQGPGQAKYLQAQVFAGAIPGDAIPGGAIPGGAGGVIAVPGSALIDYLVANRGNATWLLAVQSANVAGPNYWRRYR